MDNASQETTVTETKALSITDENISQSDFERLRKGEKVEVEVKSEPKAKKALSEKEVDVSETSQTDGDENDDLDSDESEMSAKDNEGHKKPARGFKRRIDKLNARITEKEAELEHWKQQALRDQNQKQQEEIPVVASSKGEPNPDDYETAGDYYRAHARFVVLEETKAAKEAERQEKFRLEAETKKTAFHGRVEEFQKAHDDFEEVIADVDDIMMSPAISQVILESDDGPELMYELAKNREEYARICALPPFEAARALGRFESRIQKPSEENKTTIKTKTTKAPPPVAPISAKGTISSKKSIYDEDVPFNDYVKLRREQIRKRP